MASASNPVDAPAASWRQRGGSPMLDNTALKNNGKSPEKVLTTTEATC